MEQRTSGAPYLGRSRSRESSTNRIVVIKENVAIQAVDERKVDDEEGA